MSKRADSYCTPVDKNGEGIVNPDNTLTCYQIRSEKLAQEIVIDNQFGEQTFQLKKSKRLCVPSRQLSSVNLDDEDDDDDDDD